MVVWFERSVGLLCGPTGFLARIVRNIPDRRKYAWQDRRWICLLRVEAAH